MSSVLKARSTHTTSTTCGGLSWAERGCISQLCDESRQQRAFLHLPASISNTMRAWRRLTTATATLGGRSLLLWKHKTALKVSAGLEEQQCECAAQRPTWQSSTASAPVVIQTRLRRATRCVVTGARASAGSFPGSESLGSAHLEKWILSARDVHLVLLLDLQLRPALMFIENMSVHKGSSPYVCYKKKKTRFFFGL